MNENAIRDLLAKDLSILEAGLQLIKIEQFIPSTLGTRSFLDILAKDSTGHWVIIEVKKTNAASREAAHEVFKYVEAVQHHFGARNDEIRAIVASVEWTEMLVPFSRLRKETTIAVEGVQLVLDDCGENLQIVPVEPVSVNQGRYLAPWHELNVYHDESSLERGLVSYDECCKAKGMDDYVLVVLKAAEDFHERATLALGAALHAVDERFGINGEESTAPGIFDLQRSEYILYFSPQILTKEFCLSVIAREPELLEEVTGFTAGMDEKAELCILHENVYDAEPRPFRDHLEIGYAAKFTQKLLIDEEWTIERVLRRGTFERNVLLSDEAIVEELKGWSGNSGRSFNRSISLKNRAHVSSARDGIATALASNPAWQAQINRVFDAISTDTPDGCANIHVFNPSSGVFTLYFMATEEDSLSHMPRYEVAVTDVTGVINTVYIGLLVPSGKPMGLNEILEKYYDGRMGSLMFLASAGFYESKDAEILDDLGLVYRTFRLDDPSRDQEWFELRDDRWRSFAPTMPFQPLQPYFDKQIPLIRQIVDTIGSRMHEGFHDMS